MNGHTREASRIIGLEASVLTFDRYAIFLRIDPSDPRVITWRDALGFAPTRVAKHVTRLVLSGPLAVCACHLLTRLQNAKLMLVFAHVSTILHFTMDQRIQFAAGFIVGRYNQRPL